MPVHVCVCSCRIRPAASVSWMYCTLLTAGFPGLQADLSVQARKDVGAEKSRGHTTGGLHRKTLVKVFCHKTMHYGTP